MSAHYGAAWTWFPPTAARPTMSPGDLRASLLLAADYLDASLDAQVEGDDSAVVHALEVLAAIVQVVTGQMRAPSENRATLQ
jgi:hypothetical protein